MRKTGVKGSRGQGFEGKRQRKSPTVFNSKFKIQNSKLIFPGDC
jgi:hypothetical protein